MEDLYFASYDSNGEYCGCKILQFDPETGVYYHEGRLVVDGNIEAHPDIASWHYVGPAN